MLKKVIEKETFHGLSVELRRIGPEEARHWRDTKHFEGRQRRISPSNVNRLAEEQREGTFRQGTQIDLAVLPNGEEKLLDTNHSLEAVALSGLPQIFTVLRRQVKDLDEAGLIYGTFDDQKRRGIGDAIKAAGCDIDDRHLSAIGSAINVINNDFLQGGKTWVKCKKRQIIEKIDDYEKAADAYLGATEDCSAELRRYTRRAPLMAVGLVTVRFQPETAVEFWRRFSRDSGLEDGMPEHTLLKFMRNLKEANGEGRPRTARAVALAWNASHRGEKIYYLKTENVKRFALLGTPWEKGISND